MKGVSRRRFFADAERTLDGIVAGTAELGHKTNDGNSIAIVLELDHKNGRIA